MTSYFDSRESNVREGELDSAIAIEEEVIATVNLVTGDREFPDEHREKIQGLIARWRLKLLGDEPRNERAIEWFDALGYSRLLEELHSAFHELAGQHIETRFGLLTDKPDDILARRDEHDEDAFERFEERKTR